MSTDTRIAAIETAIDFAICDLWDDRNMFAVESLYWALNEVTAGDAADVDVYRVDIGGTAPIYCLAGDAHDAIDGAREECGPNYNPEFKAERLTRSGWLDVTPATEMSVFWGRTAGF